MKKRRMTYTQIIAFSFFCVILVGAVLLSLPISSRSGVWTNPVDAFFTSTSATCVTGLVAFDTYSYWTTFGQVVILILIQVGGLGFMTLITMLSIFLRRKISLHERLLLMQTSGNMRLSGVVSMIKRIIIGTLIFEISGAAILATRFCPQMGLGRGMYNAVFHSVSAFCNAGFDLMGRRAPFSSFTAYSGDSVVNLTLIALIVVGGIGFLVWSDIIKFRFKFRMYSFNSKVVLSATFFLLLTSTVLFYIFERNGVLDGLPEGEKWITSLFGAVTPRTAGFNTVDYSAVSDSTSLLTMINMFIGGSPGSTAGGVKTTTVVILITAALASARRSSEVTIFKRRFSESALRQASAIVTIYVVFVLTSSIAICAIDPWIDIKDSLFETISAAGTVGLTTGVTTMLSSASKIILMVLMFGGRVGGLSLMLLLAEKRDQALLNRPHADLLIG